MRCTRILRKSWGRPTKAKSLDHRGKLPPWCFLRHPHCTIALASIHQCPYCSEAGGGWTLSPAVPPQYTRAAHLGSLWRQRVLVLPSPCYLPIKRPLQPHLHYLELGGLGAQSRAAGLSCDIGASDPTVPPMQKSMGGGPPRHC